MSLALLAVLVWWILQRMSARSLLIQTLNGLSFGAVLFFLASGFTLISGLMRVADLAHAGFYLVGGYIGFSVMRATPNFALALLSAGAGITVVGLFTERVLLRPIRGLEKPEVLLTIGVTWATSPTNTVPTADRTRSEHQCGSRPTCEAQLTRHN
jgi:branched-subunit amino acid ABC-type transport system permease component